MELVNHTPVPASIVTTELSDGLRGGIITAKATFRFAADQPDELATLSQDAPTL